MENRDKKLQSAFYKSIGALYQNDGSCSFTVWAPLKKNVSLVIYPENKTYPMQRDEQGYWTTMLQNITPGTKYMFKLDGEISRPDPASLSQPNGVHEASEVVDRNFSWTDNEWKGIELKDMILYELHTGAFTSEHTFKGIISKFGYLKELGINTIEIMPIAQFPGSRNWGYDGVYPYAVQDSYGGVNGLKELVNEAHKNNLAVVLDVVYNHLGPEGNYLKDYGPYFTEKYNTPWGDALNFDDAYCDGIRNFFLQNALMWLDEFHLDGLRLDAVHAIIDLSAKHFIQQLKEEIINLEKRTGRRKILIAEIDLNNVRYINPIEKGGYGIDGQWIDEFHHALHSVITGETSGYYEDFGTMKELEKAFRNPYVYDGAYSPHRKKIFGSDPSNNALDQFIVFTQNHDQVGNRVLGDRLTETLSFEEIKLAAASVLLSPYVPMLFMGEEYGEKNPFLYFVSHSDKQLIENIRTGRKKEFSYFNFTEEFPDPESEETFEKSMLSWNLEDEQHALTFKFQKYLIAFRKKRKAMQNISRDSLFVHPAYNKIIALERRNKDDHLLVLFNYSKEKDSYKNPASSSFKKIFDSSSTEWKGLGGITPSVIHQNDAIEMNGMSAIIFEQTTQL
ncbi:MAG: malto-oligosyltrehalose trehalohydrolase [Ilyomonas sp.]